MSLMSYPILLHLDNNILCLFAYKDLKSAQASH